MKPAMSVYSEWKIGRASSKRVLSLSEYNDLLAYVSNAVRSMHSKEAKSPIKPNQFVAEDDPLGFLLSI